MEGIGHALSSFGKSLKLLTYNKVGFAGFLVVLGIVLMTYVGSIFVPLDTKTKIDQIYLTPSWEHPLGTDHQGRDVWTQIVHGGKDVIYVAIIAALLSTTIAVSFGTLSGFVGGRIDALIMALTDIILTIPQFPLLGRATSSRRGTSRSRWRRARSRRRSPRAARSS